MNLSIEVKFAEIQDARTEIKSAEVQNVRIQWIYKYKRIHNEKLKAHISKYIDKWT